MWHRLSAGRFVYFFSQESIRQTVKGYIQSEKPPFKLAFESIDISLSNGLWPRFGIEVKSLRLSSKDPCVTGSQIDIESMYLPVSPFSILSQHLRFGKINAVGAHFNWSPRLCEPVESLKSPPKTVAEKALGFPSEEEPYGQEFSPKGSPFSKASFKREIQKFQEFMNKKWKSELRQVEQWVEGFEVRNLIISQGTEKKPLIEVEKASVYLPLDGEKLIIESRLKPPRRESEVGVGELMVVQARLEMNSENQQLFVTSRVKEGTVKLHVRTNVENLDFDTDIDIRHLPLKEIGRIFNKYGNFNLDFQPKMLWLNCRGRWRGQLHRWEKSQLKTNACQIVGDKGRVSFSNLEVSQWKKPFFKKFSMKISKLSMERLAEFLSGIKIKGILDRFGLIDGEVNFLPESGWDILLKIRDVSLAFSRRGKRLAQKVSKIQINGNYNELRGLLVKVGDIEMENGVFNGEVTLRLDKDLKKGLFLAKIKRLNFAPKVQELMLGEFITPLSFDVSVNIQEGAWRVWEGEVRTAEIRGQNFNLGGIQFKGQFEKKTLTGKIQAQKGTFTAKHSYFPWLSPLFLAPLTGKKGAKEPKRQRCSESPRKKGGVNKRKLSWKKRRKEIRKDKS